MNGKGSLQQRLEMVELGEDEPNEMGSELLGYSHSEKQVHSRQNYLGGELTDD